MPEKSARAKRRRRAVLALALSALAACAVAEIASRSLWGAPLAERLPLLEVRANPRRTWEMIPGQEHYTYAHAVHVNALGLRGPEYDAARPTIVCLGDSLVYGQGVGEADTIPAALERELAASGSRAQVLNGGLRAYNTAQEMALLEELLERGLRPEAVLLCWFPNDVEEPYLGPLLERLQRDGPIVFDVSARLEGWVKLRWRLKQLARSSALVMRLHDAFKGARATEVDPQTLERAFANLDGYLARLAELARAHGFRPFVARLPVNLALQGALASDAWGERMAALARARAIPVLDPLPELRELARDLGRLPVLAYDGHYDERANAAIAGVLARALRAP